VASQLKRRLSWNAGLGILACALLLSGCASGRLGPGQAVKAAGCEQQTAQRASVTVIETDFLGFLPDAHVTAYNCTWTANEVVVTFRSARAQSKFLTWLRNYDRYWNSVYDACYKDGVCGNSYCSTGQVIAQGNGWVAIEGDAVELGK
jgi:hypothetical protein